MNFVPSTVEVDTDVLVVGSGLAGLMSAIEAAYNNAKVVVVTKGRAARSGNTIMSQNGMAAVLEEGYDGDSIRVHVKDTLAAGKHVNNVRMVEVFAEKAGTAINRLLDLGVPFSKENGVLSRRGAPGHSCKRFLTVDGSSFKSPKTQGLALTLPLASEAMRLGVCFIERVLITDLLKNDGQVVGAWGLDRKEEKVWLFRSPTVILACGGAGGLYPVSTNAADITGDSYALASLAGARLRDMEFVQFYPAVTLEKPKVIVPTSLFAYGAVLRNKKGERYMSRYSREMEMATRDVMARASFLEVREGRGTEYGGVYMDLTSVPEEVLREKYSSLNNYLKGRRVVEVAPAMHFMMGGVEVNEACRTALPGLYAAGESAGGLHGANRLAGNALTEAAVFGMIAGREAAMEAKKFKNNLKNHQEKDFINEIKVHWGRVPGLADAIRKELKKIMGEKVALIRRKKDLEDTVDKIINLKGELSDFKIKDWKTLIRYYQTRLMLEVGEAVAKAALAREKSLGAHYIENNQF